MAETEKKPIKKKPSKPRKKAKIDIKMSWCKSCGLCVEYCNPGTLVMEGIYPKVVTTETCTLCLQCENICPDFAIEVREDKTKAEATEKKPS